MSKLNVELYGHLLGYITEKTNNIHFEVNPDIFRNYPIATTIMSVSVPLIPRLTNIQNKRAANFFSELLPEGKNLDWLTLGLPPKKRTTFGLLKTYGRDIAGALNIFDPTQDSISNKPYTEHVDGKYIRFLLEHMPIAALANAPKTGRTSLGGVQGKILLARIEDKWHRVHNGYPSTHIIKSMSTDYPTMIYDEAFSMQLAYDIGLTKYPVWLENFDGLDALVIERYDRTSNTQGGRIHQEDFNQALGAHGIEKYQEYGGKVNLKRIAQIIEKHARHGDVIEFAKQVVFSVAIGNLDMHAKNISLLHDPHEGIQLAPVYDQVPLLHHNTDGKMAMSINGVYEHHKITLDDIVKEIMAWNCNEMKSKEAIITKVREWLEMIKAALCKVEVPNKAYPQLQSDIKNICIRIEGSTI